MFQDGKVEIVTVNPGEESKWVDPATFEKYLKQFQSWDWIYGDTPKFTIPMEADDGTALCLHCEKGRITKLEQTGGPVTDAPLLKKLSSAITGKKPTSQWVEKLNAVLVGKKLTFMEIHRALMKVEMELNAESEGPTDPYEQASQIIDRLRGMATCF